MAIAVLTHAGARRDVRNVERELEDFASTEKWATILGYLREQFTLRASPQPPSKAVAELSAFVGLIKQLASGVDLSHSLAAAAETSAQV